MRITGQIINLRLNIVAEPRPDERMSFGILYGEGIQVNGSVTIQPNTFRELCDVLDRFRALIEAIRQENKAIQPKEKA